MKNTFNISGPADKVTAVIEKAKNAIGTNERLVTDVFKADADKRDVNVSVDDKFVDELSDICEDAGVKCELV